jgi:hypothetical protein
MRRFVPEKNSLQYGFLAEPQQRGWDFAEEGLQYQVHLVGRNVEQSSPKPKVLKHKKDSIPGRVSHHEG